MRRVLIGLLIGLPLLYVGTLRLIGVRRVPAGAPPLAQQGSFDHGPFDDLLRHHVINGQVDYSSMAADSAPLRSYLAGMAVAGPATRPELFPDRQSELTYWLNAYNAATLLGVLDSWPIETVHDVHGPIAVKAGFGFFWGLRFRLDGRWINLYDLEHKVIRPFGDARIHSAINCASASCPRLPSRAWRASDLAPALDSAAVEFAGPPHVQLLPAERTILLSSIYSWFAEDFEQHAAREGWGEGGTLDYIARYAPAETRAGLARAREEGWEVRFADYDWSLNGR